MATLLAHIKIKAGAEERFEAVARDMFERTHADERAVRRYEFWRGAEPSTYYCLESFDDLHGFLEHQTSRHHEDHGPTFGEVIEEMWLEWVDPITGASPLAPTNDQPLGPAATEAMRDKYARFSSIAAAWWSAHRAVAGER